MADFDHEIISRGNCMICGKPIDIDSIYLCSECMKKKPMPQRNKENINEENKTVEIV